MRTVSGLKGFQVPLLRAPCNSVALIAPDLSLSTEANTYKINNIITISMVNEQRQ